MNRNLKVVFAALLLAFFLAGEASAYRVFVWRHDNGLRCADPVLGGSLTATESVVRTLTGLRQYGIEWDSSATLPEDLSQYDVVMTCLSFLCPG